MEQIKPGNLKEICCIPCSRQPRTYLREGGLSSFPKTFFLLVFACLPNSSAALPDTYTEAKPVVWIESGGGHSLYDLIGLMYDLRDLGHRVCIYDRPGMGLST